MWPLCLGLLLNNQIHELEKGKKNATRFVTGDNTFITCKTPLYLRTVGKLLLEEQRDQIKVTTLYEGLNGHIDTPLDRHNQINQSCVKPDSQAIEITI